MTRREELERRIKSLSNSRPVWIALALQAAALVIPFLGIVAIVLMLIWLMIAALARWATKEQLANLARKEQQAEADARDFLQERKEQIQARLQAMLEAEARARFRRSGSREMFKGNCIDITENP